MDVCTEITKENHSSFLLGIVFAGIVLHGVFSHILFDYGRYLIDLGRYS
jgi:hypothetical protein